MLLGDFNSVTNSLDHFSHQLDLTSTQLINILKAHDLCELNGSHLYSFTYHPSVPNQKSRLDHIYLNYEGSRLRGYSSHATFSDHYIVELFLCKKAGLGPKPWWFPSDLLDDPD